MKITRERLIDEITEVVTEMIDEGAGSPWHGTLGKFVNPKKKKGSYSIWG